MQTFLPYPEFKKSFQCLEYKRLGKQRLEARQILDVLAGKTKAWQHHPAILMWKSYEKVLSLYYNLCLEEWIGRGYKNIMKPIFIRGTVKSKDFPWWLGEERLHRSHRSNLLRKDIVYYGQFNWKEPNCLPYWWPVRYKKSIKERMYGRS